MPYRTIQVTPTPVPILEVLGNVADMYTLANNDIVNSIYICERRAFSVGDSDVVEIPALGSAPLATDHGTYARTAQASPVSCLLIPGTGGWTAAPSKIQASLNALGLMKDTTGAAINTTVTGVAKDATVTGVAKDATLAAQTSGATIASDVSNTGVPLLPKASIVVNDGTQTILTTATRSLGPFTLTRISYEIFVGLQEVTAGTALKTVTLGLKFTDSVSGQIVDQVTFDVIPAANTSGITHQVLVSGPTRGDTVTVTLLNNDTVSVSSTFLMLQTSRIFTHDHKFRSINTPTYITLTTGGNHPSGGVLIDAAPSVAAAAIAQRIMSCYNGPAVLSVNIPVGGAASFFIQHTDPLSLNSGIVEQFTMTAPPTRLTQFFDMPRSQCVINLQNNGGATGVLAATCIIEDN